jgi:hypothetical protein
MRYYFPSNSAKDATQLVFAVEVEIDAVLLHYKDLTS